MALETLPWLNTDFTERVLRLAKDDTTIQVTDIFTKPATAKGDNYTSDLIRLVAEYTRKHGKIRISDKTSLLFKFEPIEEGIRREAISKSQIFDTEIAMMSDTLQKMNDLLGSRLSGRVFYVRMERPLCLIIEDLAPMGFRMADRQLGFDMAHCRIAIRGLAKFHATSVALCEKEPKHKDLYWRGIFHDESPEEIKNYFITATRSLANEVENWVEGGKRYAVKLRNMAPRMFQLAVDSVRRKDDEFNVINHGDSWVNNMMFRYDENSKPIEHIFVDFQLSVYSSPAVDLHYFLSSSVSEEISDLEIESLLQDYQQTLAITMKQLECDTMPPTMKQIKKTMDERYMYALITSMGTLPIALIDKSNVQSLEEMIRDNGQDNPGFKNPVYRRIMIKRLKKFEDAGLLDQ
ncbi:PREDICTED: uncharacterized protein LOC108555576 [Eufriesea mexicana]|uniref:uncharacterized protein LOC108555576 n=1 Tax=Eufriesea mexicana TaxID=516756 RepID=UPI00083C44DA|nr:PREDICTED: uncharacterized protein LOC108555576 [Eufriesea mexicana]